MSITSRAGAAEGTAEADTVVSVAGEPAAVAAPSSSSPSPSVVVAVGVATPSGDLRPNARTSIAGRPSLMSANVGPSRSSHAARTEARHRNAASCSGAAVSSSTTARRLGTSAGSGASRLTWHKPHMSARASAAAAPCPPAWHERA